MKKRILVADDDAEVRNSLGRVLESEDYDVIFAQNGCETISKFLTVPYDLVLLDLNMPHTDGWEAFDWLSKVHPLMPVIVITARPNQYPHAARSGVDALMEKPLDLPLLLQTIRDLVMQSEAQRIARLSDEDFTPAYLCSCEEPVGNPA